MNRADEKKAFEAMLAEVDDSDEEDGIAVGITSYNSKTSSAITNGRGPSSISYKSDAKSFESARPTDLGTKSNYNDPFTGSSSSLSRGRSQKMSKEEQDIENFGSSVAQSPAEELAEKLNTTKRWLARPCGSSDRNMMRCYVERERSNFGLHIVYRCYLEGTGSENTTPRFMMSAKKKIAKQTSYYLISLDMDPEDDRGSESVVGKVRGNSVGSKYIITDHGLPPEKTVAPSMFRKELGVISFEFDSGGPSRIEAWVPFVSQSGIPVIWQPDGDATSMETAIDNNNLDKIFCLQNKAPKWDEVHGGHVLNFQGRVTESSVKNFQMCFPGSDDPDEVILQFGRVGKHKFNMDLRFPLSPIQAFAICVACLDGKLADRRGYEYIRKLRGKGDAPENSSNASRGDGSSNASTSTTQMDGNMKGSASISGMLRESLPTGQYIKDRIYRSFK